jgi:hypothetical protein
VVFGGGQLGTRLQKVAKQEKRALREAHKSRMYENEIILKVL